MTDAEGSAPAATGKAEPPADVSGTPVPESGAEAAAGPKGGDAEGSGGAVGWGLEAEEGRADVLAEFWGDEPLGGAGAGGEAPAARDGGDAGGPAREPGADGPGREEAAPPVEAAGRPADPVAGGRGPEAQAQGAEGGDAGVAAREPDYAQAVAAAAGPAAALPGVEGAAMGSAADMAARRAEVDAQGVEDELSGVEGEEAGAAVAEAGNGGGGAPEGGGEAGQESADAAVAAGAPAVEDALRGEEGEEAGPAAGGVLAAVEALRFELGDVEEVALGLRTKLGEVSKELGEIKGKLDAVGEAPGKEADGSRETVKEGLGKIEAMISDLRDSLIAQSELVKQAGEGQGEKGGDNFLSQLREMLQAGLQRVDERIEGVVEAGNKQSEAFEGVKLEVEVVKKVGASVGNLEERLEAYKKDLSRDRELVGGARRWVVLALAAFAAPALVLAGTFVGQQWQVLPLQESTGGWKEHVWERYGLDLVECVKTGVRQGGPYDCTVDVGASVDQVRRASGR